MQQLLLVYGKIIIDNIWLRSGKLHRSALGGGGPQAAFGMRLWHDPVALLTRSGTDLDPEPNLEPTYQRAHQLLTRHRRNVECTAE